MSFHAWVRMWLGQKPAAELDYAQEGSEFATLASTPFVFQLSEEHMKLFLDDAGLDKKALQQFIGDFTKSTDRTTKGRGARRLAADSDACLRMQELLKGALPKDAFVQPEGLQQKLMVPSWFGLLKDNIGISAEVDNFAVFRASIIGTRSVLLVKLTDILAFMQVQKIGADFTTPTRAWSFMKSMTTEQLNAFTEKCSFHCGTLAPRDVVYVPTGFVVAEKTLDTDNIGMCWRGLVPQNQVALQVLNHISAHLKDTLMNIFNI